MPIIVHDGGAIQPEDNSLQQSTHYKELYMKLSQFIKLLQRLEYECGDLAVVNPDNYTPKAECKKIDGIGTLIVIK